MNRSQPILAFLEWWGTELRSFVPRALYRALGLQRDQLLIRLEGRNVDAFVDRGAGPEPIAATEVAPEDWGDLGTNFSHALQVLDSPTVETTLLIGSSQVVHRHLRVPPTPDRDLPGLLSFEIERHTPFKPDEAHFSFQRDAAHGESVDVTINVAPRRIVDPLIAGLTRMGFPPTHVTLGDQDRRGVHDLGVPAPRGRLRVAVLMLALLLIAAAASPVLRLEAIADDLATSLQTTRQSIGANAQSESAQALATRRFLENERTRYPSPLAILNELSTLLPDGTWLVQYDQAGRDITLEGQTESSADLIPLLEGSSRFRSVQYDAPVTREGRDGDERFTFSLRLTENPS